MVALDSASKCSVTEWKKIVQFMNSIMQTTVAIDQSFNNSVFFPHLVIKEQGNLKVFGKVVTPNQLFPSTRYVQSKQFNS